MQERGHAQKGRARHGERAINIHTKPNSTFVNAHNIIPVFFVFFDCVRTNIKRFRQVSNNTGPDFHHYKDVSLALFTQRYTRSDSQGTKHLLQLDTGVDRGVQNTDLYITSIRRANTRLASCGRTSWVGAPEKDSSFQPKRKKSEGERGNPWRTSRRTGSSKRTT